MPPKINQIINSDVAILLIKEGLAKGLGSEFQIISNSMHPVLKIGDKIKIKKASLKDLICGDIVIYKLNGRLIAHRFLYLKDEKSFICRGDNISIIDQPVANDSLIGKVTSIANKNYRINLETKIWRITSRSLGKAFSLEASGLNKNALKKLLHYLLSGFLKFLVLVINPRYLKISQRQGNLFALEKEFLKISSQKKLNPADIGLLKKIAEQDINWNMLFAIAQYNSVDPIIYRNLSQINQGFVPQDLMESLKNSYTKSFLTTAPVYDDIAKLLKEFNRQNIKAIILKGCSLAEQLYQDFSLRPMKDVDILVRKTIGQKLRKYYQILISKA
jgi:signal peptidase I